MDYRHNSSWNLWVHPVWNAFLNNPSYYYYYTAKAALLNQSAMVRKGRVSRPQIQAPTPPAVPFGALGTGGSGINGPLKKYGIEECPQCKEKFNDNSCRPVQDSCGHFKCRPCFIGNEDGCSQCKVPESPRTRNGGPTTRSCQSSYGRNSNGNGVTENTGGRVKSNNVDKAAGFHGPSNQSLRHPLDPVPIPEIGSSCMDAMYSGTPNLESDCRGMSDYSILDNSLLHSTSYSSIINQESEFSKSLMSLRKAADLQTNEIGINGNGLTNCSKNSFLGPDNSPADSSYPSLVPLGSTERGLVTRAQVKEFGNNQLTDVKYTVKRKQSNDSPPIQPKVFRFSPTISISSSASSTSSADYSVNDSPSTSRNSKQATLQKEKSPQAGPKFFRHGTTDRENLKNSTIVKYGSGLPGGRSKPEKKSSTSLITKGLADVSKPPYQNSVSPDSTTHTATQNSTSTGHSPIVVARKSQATVQAQPPSPPLKTRVPTTTYSRSKPVHTATSKNTGGQVEVVSGQKKQVVFASPLVPAPKKPETCQNVLRPNSGPTVSPITSGPKTVSSSTADRTIELSTVAYSDISPTLEVSKPSETSPKPSSKTDSEAAKDNKKKKRNPVIIHDHITVIAGDPTMFQCNVCEKKFKTKAHIKYHEFCQNGNKPFKCEQCGQGFIAKSHYEYHLRTHTGERPYVCPKCGKGFNQRGKVTRHMRSHTGEKPFICTECGRGFANAQALRSHNLIHTGERPFACKYCQKRFTGMTNLKKHIITHTGERPYVCAHCSKSFGLKWTLDLHLRTHSSERPYACDQCTRAFSNSKDLRRHLVIHSGERPFKCWICGTSFRRKDNLDRHIKNTHNQPKEVAKQLANEAAAEYLALNKSAPVPISKVNSAVISNVIRTAQFPQAPARNLAEKDSSPASCDALEAKIENINSSTNQSNVTVIITAELSPRGGITETTECDSYEESYILPDGGDSPSVITYEYRLEEDSVKEEEPESGASEVASLDELVRVMNGPPAEEKPTTQTPEIAEIPSDQLSSPHFLDEERDDVSMDIVISEQESRDSEGEKVEINETPSPGGRSMEERASSPDSYILPHGDGECATEAEANREEEDVKQKQFACTDNYPRLELVPGSPKQPLQIPDSKEEEIEEKGSESDMEVSEEKSCPPIVESPESPEVQDDHRNLMVLIIDQVTEEAATKESAHREDVNGEDVGSGNVGEEKIDLKYGGQGEVDDEDEGSENITAGAIETINQISEEMVESKDRDQQEVDDDDGGSENVMGGPIQPRNEIPEEMADLKYGDREDIEDKDGGLEDITAGPLGSINHIAEEMVEPKCGHREEVSPEDGISENDGHERNSSTSPSQSVEDGELLDISGEVHSPMSVEEGELVEGTDKERLEGADKDLSSISSEEIDYEGLVETQEASQQTDLDMMIVDGDDDCKVLIGRPVSILLKTAGREARPTHSVRSVAQVDESLYSGELVGDQHELTHSAAKSNATDDLELMNRDQTTHSSAQATAMDLMTFDSTGISNSSTTASDVDLAGRDQPIHSFAKGTDMDLADLAEPSRTSTKSPDMDIINADEPNTPLTNALDMGPADEVESDSSAKSTDMNIINADEQNIPTTVSDMDQADHDESHSSAKSTDMNIINKDQQNVPFTNALDKDPADEYESDSSAKSTDMNIINTDEQNIPSTTVSDKDQADHDESDSSVKSTDMNIINTDEQTAPLTNALNMDLDRNTTITPSFKAIDTEFTDRNSPINLSDKAFNTEFADRDESNQSFTKPSNVDLSDEEASKTPSFQAMDVKVKDEDDSNATLTKASDVNLADEEAPITRSFKTLDVKLADREDSNDTLYTSDEKLIDEEATASFQDLDVKLTDPDDSNDTLVKALDVNLADEEAPIVPSLKDMDVKLADQDDSNDALTKASDENLVDEEATIPFQDVDVKLTDGDDSNDTLVKASVDLAEEAPNTSPLRRSYLDLGDRNENGKRYWANSPDVVIPDLRETITTTTTASDEKLVDEEATNSVKAMDVKVADKGDSNHTLAKASDVGLADEKAPVRVRSFDKDLGYAYRRPRIWVNSPNMTLPVSTPPSDFNPFMDEQYVRMAGWYGREREEAYDQAYQPSQIQNEYPSNITNVGSPSKGALYASAKATDMGIMHSDDPMNSPPNTLELQGPSQPSTNENLTHEDKSYLPNGIRFYYDQNEQETHEQAYHPSQIQIVYPDNMQNGDYLKNMGVLYASATATAERNLDASGPPVKIRLLHAEAFGVVGTDASNQQLIYSSTVPSQAVTPTSHRIELAPPSLIHVEKSPSHPEVERMQYSYNPNMEPMPPSPFPVHTVQSQNGMMTHIHTYTDLPNADGLMKRAEEVHEQLLPPNYPYNPGFFNHSDYQHTSCQPDVPTDLSSTSGAFQNSQQRGRDDERPIERYRRAVRNPSLWTVGRHEAEDDPLRMLATEASMRNAPQLDIDDIFTHKESAIRAAAAIAAVGEASRKQRLAELAARNAERERRRILLHGPPAPAEPRPYNQSRGPRKDYLWKAPSK